MSAEHHIDRIDAVEADEVLSSLARRIATARSQPAPDGPSLLRPRPLDRDHVQGPDSAPASLVVFGSYGTPASRPLGELLARLRESHPASLRITWRHLPEAEAHPRAGGLALAAEAAAAEGRFWSLHCELLAMPHDDGEDLHAAARRAGVDFYRLLDRMRAGVGADRVVADVESARACGVLHAPALFVNGGRYAGELDAACVWSALMTTDPSAGELEAWEGSTMSTEREPRLDGLSDLIDRLETQSQDAEARLRRLEASLERAGRALAAELAEDRPPPPGGRRRGSDAGGGVSVGQSESRRAP